MRGTEERNPGEGVGDADGVWGVELAQGAIHPSAIQGRVVRVPAKSALGAGCRLEWALPRVHRRGLAQPCRPIPVPRSGAAFCLSTFH